MKKYHLIILLLFQSAIVNAEKIDKIIYFKNYSEYHLPIFLQPGENNLAFKSLEPGYSGNGFIKSKVIQNFEKKPGFWIEFKYDDRKAYLHSSQVILSKTKETFDEKIFGDYFYKTPLIGFFKKEADPESHIFNIAKPWNISNQSLNIIPKKNQINLNNFFDIYCYLFNLDAPIDNLYLFNKTTLESFVSDEIYLTFKDKYENGKIFEVIADQCKNCSRFPMYKTIFISKYKIFELPFPSEERLEYFDYISGDSPYFNIKIHNSNTLLLYSVIYYYTLKEDFTSTNNHSEFDVSNYDKKIIKTIFVKIDDIYNEPIFETFINKEIPKQYLKMFLKARKLKKS
jgi:hypothetical protein